MTTIKSLTKRLWLIAINSLVLFLLTTSVVIAQNSPYQAIRLNNGNPIIEPSMFSNPNDADNINGPSLIRVPNWIPTNERAHPSAQYYLYFGHHTGDYIRMAWAANIEGPYTLYHDSSTPGDRGVLDNNESDIILGNNTYIEENHLASPDVIVDDANQRIIMYFHSGSSYFVNGSEQNDQVTWVSTSPYGLEFYDGIEPVHLGSSYFRVFEHGGNMYALDNGSKINKALDGANPWAAPQGHDFTDHLWDQAADHVFQDDILPLTSSDLRVRHTGVHVVGNQLQAFYSRRGEYQERIQLSTVDITGDWNSWNPTYPPIEILTPNPGWEGGERTLNNSETSSGIDLNQLRDPDVFEDSDGQLYLIYTGNGEGGLGIAKLYQTPTEDTTLTTIADSYIKESSSTTFGHLNNLTASNGSSSSSRRTMYMRFDLSGVTDIDHAVVRLYANTTQSGSSVLNAGGPITVYETSNSWDINTLNNSNAPALGNVITTTYLTDTGYYDWNISEYAKANEGSEISVAFKIAPTNSISHKFDSSRKSGGNPGQLLITGISEPTDNEDPIIACIVDINQNNDASEDGANVAYTAPVGTDNLPGATTIQTAGLASNSLFPIGTTTNTFVVTDAAGNTATCSFDITITDDENPNIVCLTDISQTNDAGVDGAVVTYVTPVGTDNSTGETTIQTAGLASGELFPIGTTTNTFEVTDAAGNTATCSFDVTVTDDEDPAIVCLSDISQSTDVGDNEAIVTYAAPVGTDNVTGATTVQTAGLASGDSFPIGTTINTFEVTDTAGNTTTCSFDVTVTDNEDPDIVCIANIDQSTDAGDNEAIVTYVAPVGTDNVAGANTVQTAGLASGGSFPIGTTTNTFEVTDTAGNTAECSFDVTIYDDEDPNIVCLADINQSTDAGDNEAIVTYVTPVGTDNVTGATTVQTAGLPSGDSFPIGTTTNTFEVTDAAGNTATCSFNVTVTDDEDPSIVCLADINQSTDAGDDEAIVTYAVPVGTDNAAGANTVQTAGLASGATFPIGTTTNTFMVTDATGNIAECSFNVTVTDDEDPAIVCLADIIQTEDEGLDGAIVIYTAPVGTDNAAGANTVQTAGLASGATFPIGTTTNTFMATDDAGNTATCSFSVTVTETDNIDPTIVCLANINQSNDAGVDGAVVNYVAPIGNDNLAGANTMQTAGLASGELFPIGTTTNTFVVTDVAGNSATCSFTVTITDNEDPTIICLADINQSNDIGVDGAIVTYEAPLGTDNTTGTTTVQTAGLASGATFPIGTTTNTFMATDAAGNTATCSFSITVTDDEDPTIVCLADISQSVDNGINGAIVTYLVPVGTDNSTGAITSQTLGLASGELFPIGTTTNTFVVTDAAGNSASCSFTVTITDNIDPTIVCIADISQSNDTGVDGAIITYVAPVGTDNLAGASTIQTAGLGSGELFPIGTTTNTFKVTDVAGNTATCSFNVTVTDDEDPAIVCLADLSQSNDAGVDGAIVTYSASVGTDNSTSANTIQTNGLASGSLFPIGITTNTFVVTDTAGNTATCSFTVTVTDDEDPTIICLVDISQTEDSGMNGAIVTYTAPVGTDNSTGANTVQTLGLASGSLFPIGITTNTFVVTDATGNTATCSFTVTVTEEAETCDILIDENNFDSSWGIWNDGGTDCRRSSNDASFANGGTGKPVRLRDNTSSSVMTTDDLDLSAYTEITINFNYIADRMESGEDFWLQISTDGGSSYQTVADWAANSEFVNGTRYFESVTIQGPFPTNTNLRFRADATANQDLIYIDDVKITGCSSSGGTLKNTPTKREVIIDEPDEESNKMFFSNNPIDNDLIIKSDSIIGELHIYSLTGKEIKTVKIDKTSAVLNLSDFQSGIYVLVRISENGKTQSKLIVKK